MLSMLTHRLFEAYAHPRASARRMLAAAPSIVEAFLLAAAGYVLLEFLSRLAETGIGLTAIEALSAIGETSQEEIARRVAASKSPGYLLGNFGWHLCEVVVAAYLAWRLGGLAGGGASFRQLLGLAGWWALASVPALAFGVVALLLSAPGAIALGMVAMLAATLYIFYMLAAFVAEAHGFQSEGSVFAAALGVTFGMAMLAAAFVGA